MDNHSDISNMDIQQEERILLYLQGRMTPDEEVLFYKDLQDNPDLKGKAVNMARLAKGLSQVGAKRDQDLIESFLSSDKEEIAKIADHVTKQGKTRNVSWKKYITILSMAASVLFIIYFGYLYYDYNKTYTLGEEYAMLHESSTARGGDTSNVEKEIGELVNNVYYDKDLSKTLKRLAVLWEVSNQDTYNDYTEYSIEIGWALATGYLKDHNKEDAAIVLKKLADLEDLDTVLGKRIRELQKEIGNL